MYVVQRCATRLWFLDFISICWQFSDGASIVFTGSQPATAVKRVELRCWQILQMDLW